MTYPTVFLTRFARRLIMCFFIIVFFVTAPLFILYTAGYRYDWENKKIKQTGVISIDIMPNDAEVYLNSIKINKEIPIRLTNIAPGKYNLQIKKRGYKTWEKKIEVISKQTTYIKDVRLLKDNLPVNIFTKEERNVKNIKFSNDGKYAVLFIEENDKNKNNVKLLNTRAKKIYPILRVRGKNIPKIDWSPFYNAAFIAYTHNGSVIAAILDPEHPQKTKTYTLSGSADKINLQWQKNAPYPKLLAEDGLNIISMDFNEFKIISKIKHGDIWYVDSKNILWIADSNNQKIIPVPNGAAPIIIPDYLKINKILDINAKRAIVKSEDQSIYIILREEKHKYQKINAKDAFYNKDSKEWIVWSPWELWIIYDNGNASLLNRTGDGIKFVYPMDEHALLAVITEKSIYAFHPGYKVAQKMFGARVYNAGVNKKNNTIYFFGTVGEKDGIYELEY